MIPHRQQAFEQAMDIADAALPTAPYERRSVGIASGLGAMAIAETAVLTTGGNRPLEYIVGGVVLVGGMLSDRLSTAKLYDQTHALAEEGVRSPYYETNPLLEKHIVTGKDFWKSKRAAALNALFVLSYALAPISGVGVGIGTGVLSASNWRKSRRLTKATAILDARE